MPQPIVLADYKDSLTPYRRHRERYYCPVCDGHNLTFSPIGKWMCWNIPTREHRLEIMARLVPNFKCSTRRVQPEFCPIVLPRVHPTLLHFPLIKRELLSDVVGRRTHYWYSNSQRVVRIDRVDGKSIFPQFLNGSVWVNGAGDRSWAPYGLSRLLPYPGKTNLILVIEGQKCVEIAHSRGIPALCLEGGDYSHQTMFDKLRAIRDRLERSLLVVLPDYDLDGNRKALQIIHTARYFSLPTLLLDPLQIESDLKAGDDIEQMPSLSADRLLEIVKQQLRPP
jgi:hypothetical protein